jgi:hypothetical protein
MITGPTALPARKRRRSTPILCRSFKRSQAKRQSPLSVISGRSSDPTASKRVRWQRVRRDGQVRRPIRHLFLFIGADPNTDWLAGSAGSVKRVAASAGEGAQVVAALNGFWPLQATSGPPCRRISRGIR